MKTSLFLLSTFIFFGTQAYALDRCASDASLNRAVTTLKVTFDEDKNMQGGVNHNAVVPYVYTHTYSPPTTGTAGAERAFLAFITDFKNSGSNSYQDYTTAQGYLNASPGAKAALANIPQSSLPDYLTELLQGMSCTQELAINIADAEDCSSINFDQSSSNAIQFTGLNDGKALSITNQTLAQVNTILNSTTACETKRSQVNAIFARGISTGDLDDYLVLNWLAQNQNQMVHSEATRILLAGATQLNKPIHGPDYSWNEGKALSKAGDVYFYEATVSTKMLILGITANALSEVQSTYDSFSRLSTQAKNSVVSEFNQNFSRALNDYAYRDQIVSTTRTSCDDKIALILGGPGAIAKATGLDLDIERFHVFKTMHMYPGDIAKAHGPLYAPKGYNAAGPGGTPGIGSYILHYPQLGRYKNVTLNFNHLADANANLLKLRSCPNSSSCMNAETNLAGSVRVGSTGGDGGAGDGPYDHSHINIIAADGTTKLNFVDAFCK